MSKDRAKGLILQLRGFDAQHYARTERYAKQIEQLFATATTEFANAAQGALFQPTEVFSFDDYPKTRQQAQRILTDLTRKVEAVITSGVKTEWLAATYKNDAFLGSILRTSQLTKEEAEQYQDRNLEALRAFQGRKIRGEMRLSGAVWNYTTNFINDVELSIDAALGEGTSAADLARKVRQNLKDPDALYRRFRYKEGEDENGNIIWGRKWKRRQYNPETGKTTWIDDDPRKHHPGQGVYRSAVKNAQRLTRTEINMAYRESEYLRWQQLDFVVGIRIALSNNHTIVNPKTGKREPFTDICDELAGDYPKTFKFLGWHPQCRCVVTPILKDYDEFNRDRANRFKAIVRKEQYKALPSRRTVTDVPANFRDYIDSIADRSKGWKSQPYYIRDNFKGGKIAGGLKGEVPTKTMNTVEPCREFDAEIERYKRWAYALGLDTSRLDALRTAGNRAALRAELDRLEIQEEERIEAWRAAYGSFATLKTNPAAQQFPDLVKWVEATEQKYKPATNSYYADSIAALKTACTEFAKKLADFIAKAAQNPVSKNMPDELKPGGTLLSRYGDDYEYSKKFFDLLDHKPKITIKNDNSGSYETRMGEEVVIASDSRLKQSPWFRRGLIYHEFGHAIGDQRKIVTRSKTAGTELTKLREDHRKRLLKQEQATIVERRGVYNPAKKALETVRTKTTVKQSRAKTISQKLDNLKRWLRSKKDDDPIFKRYGLNRHDVDEQVCAVQDTLMSLITSVGYGHSKTYFSSEYLRQHEYLAHCFENTFVGNRIFQLYLPDIYAEMVAFAKSLKTP